MLKWVSKSSALESDNSFYNYQESPRPTQHSNSYGDSPEVFLREAFILCFSAPFHEENFYIFFPPHEFK